MTVQDITIETAKYVRSMYLYAEFRNVIGFIINFEAQSKAIFLSLIFKFFGVKVMKLFSALALAVLFWNTAHAATVDVFVESDSVSVGDTFQINIFADINSPILGWGLDLGFDDQVLSLTSVTVDAIWNAGLAVDGDSLAGLAFPAPISGQSITLAALYFEAIGAGVSALELGITATDFTEGFPLLPTGFADYSLANGNVSVSPVPIPAAVWLFSSALLGLVVLRKKS